MADNTVLNAGTGGDTIATDDIAGVKVQRVKVTWGVDGTMNDASATNPLPISDAGGNVSVDDGAGSLTVDNGGTFAVQAAQSGTWTVQPGNTANTTAWKVDASSVAVPITDNAGSLTVDGTVAATQSGTWTARAQDGSGNALTSATRGSERALSVQLVDGSGAQITSFGGGTQFAEDAAHVSGDVGTLSLAVRKDANTTFVSTDGDYSPLQVDANGALKVNITAGAGSGGTAATDDAAFTVASGSGTPMMGVVTADSVDSGDVGVVGMLANRQLKITLYNSSGVEQSVGGGTQFAEDAASTSGDTGTVALAVRQDTIANSTSTDGDYGTLKINSVGRMYTSATIDAALPAGANAIGKLAANSGVDIGDIDITSVIAGTGATNLGKAEDAAAASGDTGVGLLSVRQDTLASSTSTDGDYAAVKSSSTGAVYVNVAEGGITGRAEDAAAAGGEDGIPVLAVRRDSASSGVSADGDWANLSVTSDGSLRVSGSSGTTQYVEDVASAGAESLCLMGAVRRDTAASSSGTDGDYSTINVNATGRLYTSTTVDAALPTGANVIGALTANQSVNTAQINGVTPLMGNGASGTGAQRVTLANDSTGILATVTTVSTVTNLSQLGGTAIAMNTGTRSAGTQRVTIATDDVVPASQSGTWTVQPGNTANTTAWLTSLRPGTSGGLSTFHLVSAGSTNATSVKASAGQVFGWYIYNSNAAARKVAFHNTAGTPTAGSGVIFSIVIPPTSGANVFSDIGIPFATGIAITMVTDLTDAGATAVAANDLVANIFYA